MHRRRPRDESYFARWPEENGISYRTAYAHAREINDLRTVGRLKDAKKLLAKYFPNSVKPKRFTIRSFLFG